MFANARLLIIAGLVVLGVVAPCSAAAREDVPLHLTLARELVAKLTPQNNQYVLGGQVITFPSDGAASTYSMKADCSGFLLALFDRAGYATRSRMMYLKGSARRTRHSAEDFVLSIEHEAGFKRIETIDAIRPGDLLAHAMVNIADQRSSGRTGHVLLINGQPKQIAPRKPVVANTRQFEVSIIDSSDDYSGDDDTRLVGTVHKMTGLGRATIRLYADEKGEVVGWARTFAKSYRFFSYSPRFPSDTKLRKAAIGRPLPGNK